MDIHWVLPVLLTRPFKVIFSDYSELVFFFFFALSQVSYNSKVNRWPSSRNTSAIEYNDDDIKGGQLMIMIVVPMIMLIPMVMLYCLQCWRCVGRAICIASHVRGRKGPGGPKLYQSIRQIKEVNFCSQLNLWLSKTKIHWRKRFAGPGLQNHQKKW